MLSEYHNINKIVYTTMQWDQSAVKIDPTINHSISMYFNTKL